MAHITLSGEPKSTSHIYQYACRGRFPTMYMTARGKEVKARYRREAADQWGVPPLTGDIQVYAKMYFGTRRRCDVDNFSKIMLDSLTGIAWLDDSQIRVMTVEKSYDKGNPRIEITIKQHDVDRQREEGEQAQVLEDGPDAEEKARGGRGQGEVEGEDPRGDIRAHEEGGNGEGGEEEDCG